MSIRNKTLISIFITMSLTLLGLFWVAKTVLTERFIRLEYEHNRDNLLRVEASFRDLLEQIELRSADWAKWDDAYEFVTDGNAEFRDDNVYPESADFLGINIAAYFSKEKLEVKGGGFAFWDFKTKAEMQRPADFTKIFNPDSPLLRFTDDKALNKGIVMTEGGPLLFVSRPVLKGDGTGPAAGYLVFARYLDEDIIKNREAVTKFPLHFAIVRNNVTDDRELAPLIEPVMASKDGFVFKDIGPDEQRGYLPLRDYLGNIAVMLEVKMNRAILNQGLDTIRLLMGAFTLISLLSALLVIMLLERFILLRLYRLKKNVSEVAYTDSKHHNIPVEGTDEIRKLGDAINRMLLELDSQHRQIEAMLTNMQQGLCMVDQKGQIHGQASHYFWSMFQLEECENFQLMQSIFGKSNLSQDEVQVIRTLLEVSVGEDKLAFDLNSGNLPSTFRLELQGDSHEFECDWSTVLNDDDIIESILITFRDVTRLRQLEAANEQEKQSMRYLLAVLKMGADRFHKYSGSAYKCLDFCRDILRQATWSANEHVEMKRALHTLKGNSRVYGLVDMASMIHEMEEFLLEISKAQGIHYEQLCRDHKELQETLAKYADAAVRLGYQSQDTETSEATFPLPHSLLQKTLQYLEERARQMLAQNEGVQELKTGYLRLLSWPLQQVIDDMQNMASSLAVDLQLPPVKLDLRGSEAIYLMPEAGVVIRDALVHLVRNSLYHGFLGVKETQLMITIEVKLSADQITLNYSDTGKGLSCSKLRELGKKRAYAGVDSWGPERLVELIFEEGISTAEKVNDISGRGTGMGAVRSMLEELEGRLLPRVGKEASTGYAPLGFILEFPRTQLVETTGPKTESYQLRHSS